MKENATKKHFNIIQKKTGLLFICFSRYLFFNFFIIHTRMDNETNLLDRNGFHLNNFLQDISGYKSNTNKELEH